MRSSRGFVVGVVVVVSCESVDLISLSVSSWVAWWCTWPKNVENAIHATHLSIHPTIHYLFQPLHSSSPIQSSRGSA